MPTANALEELDRAGMRHSLCMPWDGLGETDKLAANGMLVQRLSAAPMTRLP